MAAVLLATSAAALVLSPSTLLRVPLSPSATLRVPYHHSSVRLRSNTPVLQEGENEMPMDAAEVQRKAQRARDLEIRAGGFVNNRPPSDLDKLETFSFDDVEPVGKAVIGLSGVLLLIFFGYLVIA